jgi:phosphohistidine phosphatase
MRTLHLLRHAKSLQNGERDFGRPLARRGVSAARRMARYMEDAAFDVDHVYCSSARRTRQTFDAIEDTLTNAPATFESALYLASADSLTEFVHGLPADEKSVLLIGHNPGFHDLAVQLTQTATLAAELDALRAKFPTGALCSLEFRGGWRDVGPGKGRLVAFVRPRDLE